MKISDERFIALMGEAQRRQYARINEQYRDKVPESFDRAAEKTLRRLEGWVAAGAVPPQAVSYAPKKAAKGAAKASLAIKTAAVVLSAALIGAGSYAAVPAVRDAVNSALGIGHIASAHRVKASADYIIPDPGEPYELQDSIETGTTTAKWFAGEGRLLMVQIAEELPELPEGAGEAVTVGGTVGMVYDIDGDQVLLLYDGGMTILIKIYTADRQELLDYAQMFAAANGL